MEIDPHLPEIANTLRSELAWTPGLGWLYWAGKVWLEQDSPAEGAVTRWADEQGHKLSQTRLSTIVRQLRGALEIEDRSLDAHPCLLNVQNGVVDLGTGELRPHDPALLLTRVAAVDYDPDATHPAWERVLVALPDDSSLGTSVAEAMTGHPSGVATVIHGQSPSGKTAFVGILCDALGTHALRTTADWPESRDLRGVRLAVAEDVGRIDSGRLKLLFGRNEITTRHPRRETLTFRLSHSLVLVTNRRPLPEELDSGTGQRLRQVEFAELDAPDSGLGPRLKEPKAQQAALAWAVSQALQAARA